MKQKTIIYIFFLFVLNIVFAQKIDLKDSFIKNYLETDKRNYINAISTLLNTKDVSYPTLIRLAYLYNLNKQYSLSIKYYDLALKVMPISLEALIGKTYSLNAILDYDNLIKTYLDILKIEPTNYNANYALANIYYYNKNYTKAKYYLDILINYYPFNYDVIILSAWNFLYLGNKEFAKNLFNKSFLIFPNNLSAKEGLFLIK